MLSFILSLPNRILQTVMTVAIILLCSVVIYSLAPTKVDEVVSSFETKAQEAKEIVAPTLIHTLGGELPSKPSSKLHTALAAFGSSVGEGFYKFTVWMTATFVAPACFVFLLYTSYKWKYPQGGINLPQNILPK